MLQSIQERVKELRKEIEEINELHRRYLAAPISFVTRAEHERRQQRLQAILDELLSMTEWKKP
jgi:hypothetical protein